MRFISAVAFILALFPIYTIDHPRLVLHSNDHLMQVKWFQYVHSSPKLVVVFKVSYTPARRSICSDVDWSSYLRYGLGYPHCYDIFREWVTHSGYITVSDRDYRRGDRYFIMQYDFTSHNAPYGPYTATVR